MGNPGRRRVPDVQLPNTGPAVMPSFLRRKKRAAQLWNEYGPTLVTLGTLKAESAHMFAIWCSLVAEFEKNPSKFTATKITQIRTLSSSLGMDPSDQARIPRKADGNKDPAEAFFTGPVAVND